MQQRLREIINYGSKYKEYWAVILFSQCLIPAGCQAFRFIHHHLMCSIDANRMDLYETAKHANPYALYSLTFDDSEIDALEIIMSRRGGPTPQKGTWLRYIRMLLNKSQRFDKTVYRKALADKERVVSLSSLCVYYIREQLVICNRYITLHSTIPKLNLPNRLADMLRLKIFP